MQEIRWAVWTALLLQIVLLRTPLSLGMQGMPEALALNSSFSPGSESVENSVMTTSPAPAKSPRMAVSLKLSEVAALFDLRGGLGIRSRYWPRGTDPCAWKGIYCDDGHVIDIELSGLRRTLRKSLQSVFVLDSLQKFPFLLRLNASGFRLPGAIPDWFGRLTNLQLLDFTSASLKGPIPFSLGDLSNLRVLILAHNSLTGDIPTSFGKLNKLTSLDLSFNGLTGELPTFANLINLTELNLSGNNLTGDIPAGIGRLIKLKGLLLANNLLEGSIPNQLGDLYLLTRLDLSSNILTGPIPHEVGRLAFLNILILSNNYLNGSVPIEIVNCRKLQVLSADHNSLVGTIPPLLGSLKNLSTLSLSFNNLTGVLPAGISSLPAVKFVVLSHNLFYGLLPAGLTNLSKLVTVDLSHNYLNGSVSGAHFTGAFLAENCFSGIEVQRTFEACESFYKEKGLPFHGAIVVPHASPQIAIKIVSKESKHPTAIVVGMFGGLGLVLVVIVLVLFVLKQEHKIDSSKRETVSGSRKRGTLPFSGRISVNLFSLGDHFSYSQLQQATGEFSSPNLLKVGHSGDLYQGLLEGGLPIVVKRINVSKFKKDAHLRELELFAKASHTRLVSLLGHCLEREDEKLLVYKYLPNRDLAYVLHRSSSISSPEDTMQSLDWITRLKIAIGAAEGLSYLHHECAPPLVHRDVQASSILLDDKFEVRLGSLTEACVAESEAHHGVIARLFRLSQTSEQRDSGASISTCPYDVYCFGKVLLELVSGKLGISGSTDPVAEAWLEWALPLINIYDKESVTKLLDPSLIVDEDLLEEVWAMAIVAKSCLNPKPTKRPLMRYIVKALENPLKVVREDNLNGSLRSRTSSHGSWSAAFFGSWRHSSSETVIIPGSLREEYLYRSNSKQTGNGGAQVIMHQGEVSHRRPGSNEIFPEPDSSVQSTQHRF